MRHGMIFRPVLLILFLIFASLVPTALFAADVDIVDDEQCYPYCYEDTPVPPSEGGGVSWGGYSDGRVAPDMAEYYTVYCANDLIEVWGGKPSPQLIQSIPLVRVLQTDPNGGFFDAGAGLTVARPNEAIIVITGTNGNNAPTQGSKIFGLQECIDRNGRMPLVPAPASTATASAPNALPACSLMSQDPLCYDTLHDWCIATYYQHATCQPFHPNNTPQNAVVASVQFCLSAFMMVGFAPGLYLLHRRKRR